MMSHRQRLAVGMCLIASAIAGCAKPHPQPAPPPVTIQAPPQAKPKAKAAMTIAVSPDVNPDATGRPSPVVVRIYQLKNDGAFNRADFFTLFDDEQKALGPELLSRDEFQMAPAERKTIDVAVSEETRFVGAIAAFRDIRNSQWRVLTPTPKKGLTVVVERTRVVLFVLE